MADDLTVYGVYRSRASRVLWTALELGLSFRHVPVVQAYRLKDPDAPDAPLNTRSPAFRAINPNGHIPSIDDGGLILHESLAITLHLVRTREGPMAPLSVQEDALMTMWSFWALTELESHTLAVQINQGKDAARVAAAVAALRAPFAVLDAVLKEEEGFLVGGCFTVADLNVVEVVRYAASAVELFEAAPHVRAWYEACHARPAFVEMWARREAEPA